MKVDGSCHCGAVTFEADIDPAQVRICHCTDCQKFSGSAFRVTVHTPAAQFALRSGTPTLYIKTAASGTQRAQAFCPTCGTSLYSTDAREPKAYGIRISTLTQRTQLKPRVQIWQRSALPWVEAIGAIEGTETQ